MMRQRKPVTLVLLALCSLLLAGCTAPAGDAEIYGTATGGTLTSGNIVQKGSSTVLPLAEVWAEDFGGARQVQFTVAGGGSGAGASGICQREIDLGDMSSDLKQSQRDQCADNGVDLQQWKVAFDGLSIVVARSNTFVQDLSVEQLAMIWKADGHATRWDQVDPSFPAETIEVCFPDPDSGTYEYFNEVILEKGAPRKGFQSADDNQIVQCLTGSQYAIGYFGFAYVKDNQDKIRAVQVEGVAPSFDSIADGTYSPLSRPLYIVTDGIPTGLLADYFGYVYHPDGGQSLIEPVGYVALDENTRLAMLAQLGR